MKIKLTRNKDIDWAPVHNNLNNSAASQTYFSSLQVIDSIEYQCFEICPEMEKKHWMIAIIWHCFKTVTYNEILVPYLYVRKLFTDVLPLKFSF